MDSSASPFAEVTAVKPTVVDTAVQHTLDLSAELIWDGEHAYVVALENGHVRTLALRSKAYRRWLLSKLRAHGVKAPSNPQQWQAAAEALESRAAEGRTQGTPSVRVAGRGSVIFIDLGDEDWRCAKVTKDGWEVTPHPADGPYFYRPPRMAALPVPERGGAVDDLWRYLNVRGEEERMLLLAWLVQASWPRGPYPILPVHGPHGSTKTTLVSVAKALTDPTFSSVEIPAVTSPRKPPRDERSIIAAARNNRVIAFDNVSYLDQELSDALCRLATGAELGDRGLYTDFDEAIFAASRPILINGIPDVVGQSDLADRCVQLEAKRPAERKAESEFWNEFRGDWPRLLGTVLDMLAAALRHWAEAGERATEDVRMRNYARIGEALGVELGWRPGAFTAA